MICILGLVVKMFVIHIFKCSTCSVVVNTKRSVGVYGIKFREYKITLALNKVKLVSFPLFRVISIDTASLDALEVISGQVECAVDTLADKSMSVAIDTAAKIAKESREQL